MEGTRKWRELEPLADPSSVGVVDGSRREIRSRGSDESGRLAHCIGAAEPPRSSRSQFRETAVAVLPGKADFTGSLAVPGLATGRCDLRRNENSRRARREIEGATRPVRY